MSVFDLKRKKLSPAYFTTQQLLRKKSQEDFSQFHTAILCREPRWSKECLENKAFKTLPFMGVKMGFRKEAPSLCWAYDLPPGAPSVVLKMEELVGAKVKQYVHVGFCAALDKNLKRGDVVLAYDAVKAEGASRHYIPEGDLVSGEQFALKDKISKFFKSSNIDFKEGRCWSTDAPYRWTKDEIEHYQKEEVHVVDMQTSALFCVAEFRKVEMVSFMVVTDELYHEKWKGPFDDPQIRKNYDGVLEGLVEFSKATP